MTGCLATALLVATLGGAQAAEPAAVAAADAADLEALAARHPGEAERLREIDHDLTAKPRLARSLVNYELLLESHDGLRAQELALLDALEGDAALEKLLLDFELETTGDPGATEQVAHLDVLLAADSVFAARMRRIELVCAAAETLRTQFIDALTFFEANPDHAEPVFADPDGPLRIKDDRVLRRYTDYLARHPEIYRPWWELYDYLDHHRELCRRVYDHWFWFRPRPRLRRQWWRFRLTVAEDPERHARLWERRLYLGADPGLSEQIWQHRLSMARDPLLRRYARYILRRPEIGAALAARHRIGH
ncbi:MAG: hypothetical protein PVF43_08825 [Candidatus Eiseniibacteriota bacterium]|jgi:hypothetical protein